MEIIIVGAGIAGLTLAASLRHFGWNAQIIEQSPSLRQEGAGIQIPANGMHVMRRLGLESAIARTAFRPEEAEYCDWATGETLLRRPLGRVAAERYGAPTLQVHRSDLLQALADALPAGIVTYGLRCVGVHQDAHGAQVDLSDGTSRRADAVIGADGIHSSIREQLFGPQQTRFAKLLSWRALIRAERLAGLELGKGSYVWVGPGRSVVSYWVRPGELFNFVGTVPATEVHRESWSQTGDVSELVASFADGEPRLRHIVGAVEQAFITGLYDRDPLPTWCEGRVGLIGDAAHAMLPFLAQGACQGIEDAWTLARCLDRHGSAGVAAALQEYQTRRQPRTTRVQSTARQAVASLHDERPHKVAARNGQWIGMAKLDPLADGQWGWIYGYDAIAQAELPLERIEGLSAVFEGVRLQRPLAQRAFELRKNAITPKDIAGGVDGLREGYDRFLIENFPPPAHLRCEPLAAGEPPGWWAHPGIMDSTGGAIGGGGAGRRVVLHFHGGGYMIGSARASLDYAGRLAEAVQAPCLTLDYRLAPEHPFPAALDDARAAYRHLLARGHSGGDILLSGESSGGGLALALVAALRDAGEALPAGVIAMSPFTDLSLSGASIDAQAGRDPSATRAGLTSMAGAYVQRAEPTDPRISPLFADLRGFPPLLLQAAQNEGLRDDTTRFAERASAAGVDVTMRLYDDSVHVFALYGFLPESVQALEEVAAFARRRQG